VLRSAAALENAVVAAYRSALAFTFLSGALREFAERTLAHHVGHARLFNAAAVGLGGSANDRADPAYAGAVDRARPAIRSATDLARVCATLEDTAAQTYVATVAGIEAPDLRRLFVGVAGVEAAHRAVLLAFQTLLTTGGAGLLATPARLPAAFGPAGFPDSLYPTGQALW
jgi:hypothetical protein